MKMKNYFWKQEKSFQIFWIIEKKKKMRKETQLKFNNIAKIFLTLLLNYLTSEKTIFFFFSFSSSVRSFQAAYLTQNEKTSAGMKMK